MSLPREAPVVLLVDDEPATRELYASYLAGEGYEVMQAPNGHAALDLIARVPPDVVVTDMQMPRMSGFQLAQVLRSRAATARVPVVGLSGLVGFAAAAVAAGCNAILEKPCDPDHLAALLGRLLRRTGRAANHGRGLARQPVRVGVPMNAPAFERRRGRRA